MEEYLVPTRDAAAEFVERRSRFIGHIWVTETEAEALERIKSMREKHWDATHNVYAYLIRDGAMRYSDDGEPQGTAGMPVLEVLRRQQLYNVCCVVTRYFGGILLGAGGLVRAYTRAAKEAVEAAGISEKRVWTKIGVQCPYHLFDRLRQQTEELGGLVDKADYGAQIDLTIMVPQSATDGYLQRLSELSAGRVQGQVLSQEYRAFAKKP